MPRSGAADYRALWANVEAGATGMVTVSEQDRRREGISLPADVRNPYVPVAAPLDGYDRFDGTAFGITAGEADGINRNHLVMMEVVLEALEDAGCDPLRHPGRIGLFAAGGAARRSRSCSAWATRGSVTPGGRSSRRRRSTGCRCWTTTSCPPASPTRSTCAARR
ncbi:beta-ketoacyl synthase N-terminal-like domain-containing protein [Catellatospora bangladeshensis]|uniref:beta-ketoacyl synthase N-terminal-like domain-containing protein n=1 Tax=Catellatospora bangladeshensis TaxID=310355 RepID=UPI00361FAD10